MMSLTELEDMLIEDTENNSEKLLSILKEKRKQLNKSLETPLDKLAYNKTEQMLVACEAAQQVIELIAFRFSNNKKGDTNEKKIEQDLFKKKIEKEINIVKEMISEFDVIKKRVTELNEQARYDPLAASTLNKIIEGYTRGEEARLYNSAIEKVDTLANLLNHGKKPDITIKRKNKYRKIV